MRTNIQVIALFFTVLANTVVTVQAAQAADSFGEQIAEYGERYSQAESSSGKIAVANRFFAFLRDSGYIDDPVVFPADAHTDSVDVNVYYYIAEYYYGEGAYRTAAEYCSRAQESFGIADDRAKSDVYSLLGAAYFRLGEFDRAIEALDGSYALDRASGDFDRISSSLNGIASAFVAAGKPGEAEKYIQEAIAANSLTDNLSRRAVLYGTASEMYKSMGDGEQALSYARKALAIERERGDSARIGIRLSQVANAELATSRVLDAQRSLAEAMPILYARGNLHSWGICQNQMGDILASQDKNDEAATCYREAAAVFMKQGDRYNEAHARAGLYAVLKQTAPNEAMMHMERERQLRDSIYSTETGEAISRYNAIYYNDILQREKERAEREKRIVFIAAATLTLALLVVIGAGVWLTYRRHKRKEADYTRDMTDMQDRYKEMNRLYRNVIADEVQHGKLTEDDRQFLNRLTATVDDASEQGISDIKTIAERMRVNEPTLRRRLQQLTSVPLQTYILQIRMKKARYLLLNYRDITIAEVADRCGYSQVPNFTRAFTRFYGITPSEARIRKPKDTWESENPEIRQSR